MGGLGLHLLELELELSICKSYGTLKPSAIIEGQVVNEKLRGFRIFGPKQWARVTNPREICWHVLS
jgi:hypothetical protein